ncbi:type II secretion system protein [Aliivibrio fischeri]|uniref:type II secretion system protein n=1 Tax=Aliivibrio fischeri TaxID=668 RepID=UPI00080DD22E|nr:type II secretion system protein [Aliivibrio fischeri]OCH26423.1 MSHA biogenesis protein MshD [Aliivibrio fischeri]OED54466.1 MSHA biogenesis protein MshD [Aliivibrio fischeri]
MKGGLNTQRGLTLIESIVGIVILGFALSVLVSGVFTSSSTSHKATYQAQAATLGHSVVTDILSRQFDENSDPNGGQYRCGEKNDSGTLINCSSNLGKDGGETIAATFNDVDDFIGCWGEVSVCSSTNLPQYQLGDLIGASNADEYKNFTVEIAVNYSDVDGSNTVITPYKLIKVTLYGSHHAKYSFSAYRGNY